MVETKTIFDFLLNTILTEVTVFNGVTALCQQNARFWLLVAPEKLRDPLPGFSATPETLREPSPGLSGAPGTFPGVSFGLSGTPERSRGPSRRFSGKNRKCPLFSTAVVVFVVPRVKLFFLVLRFEFLSCPKVGKALVKNMRRNTHFTSKCLCCWAGLQWAVQLFYYIFAHNPENNTCKYLLSLNY